MAFAVTFDVLFSDAGFAQPITLSTGIDAPLTHWKHTTLWLEPQNTARVHAGMLVRGNLTYRRLEDNHRQYDVEVEWDVVEDAAHAHAVVLKKQKQIFVIK